MGSVWTKTIVIMELLGVTSPEVVPWPGATSGYESIGGEDSQSLLSKGDLT